MRATDSTGTTPAYASLAGLVAAKASTLAATAQPTLAGTAAAGQALTVDARDLVGRSAPTTFTYAWLRCNANGRLCTPIAGATAASYTLTADDSGAHDRRNGDRHRRHDHAGRADGGVSVVAAG